LIWTVAVEMLPLLIILRWAYFPEFPSGLWIRIDSIRIWIQHFCSFRIRIQFRIQAKTELSKTISFSNFLKSKFESNQLKNTVHQYFSKKSCYFIPF
jgi:hypothetical protein